MTDRPAYRRPGSTPTAERTRLPVVGLAIAAVVVVALIGVVIALVGGSGEAGDAAGIDKAFGAVTVTGTALPGFTSTEDDPAVGDLAPTIDGAAPDGQRVSVGGEGEPALVVFLAHWCPHCQAELPLLVDLELDGAFDGVRLVAVVTGTNPDAPNYPPDQWLEREGWDGDVIVDDADGTAAAAYGLEGYPFMVALDGEGDVVARTSGEVPAGAVAALAAAARGDG